MKEAQRYLERRLAEAFTARHNGLNEYVSIDEAPTNIRAIDAKVRQMEKIVERWRKKQTDLRATARIKLKRERELVREIILFGSEKAALDAVRKFEASK